MGWEVKAYCVYLLANRKGGVIYTGVSGELKIRIWKHKTKFYPDSFTSKYNVTKLVYFESFRDPSTAIKREKQIKGGSRIKKIALIEKDNPDWLDLAETWF